jgi:hypothetical protein
MVEEANYSTTFSRKSGKDYAVTTTLGCSGQCLAPPWPGLEIGKVVA